MSHTPRRAAASSTMPVPCLTNRRRVIGALCAGSLAGWLATGPGLAGRPALAAPSAPATTGRHLSAYASEAEFDAALARWRRASEALQAARRRAAGPSPAGAVGSVMPQSAPPASEMATAAAPMPAAPAMAKSEAAPAGAKASADRAAADESITNVQTAGVDEGGIVKRAGDHLVILRRGRLFTVRIGGDALRPVSMVDAYAPGSNPQGAWYDEMLISGSTVVVVGFSHARGGTEIGLFDLGPDGQLAYRATYHLRSNDYYSSRNYASRLIGRTLVFYSPTFLSPWGPSPWELMPAVRRWHGEADRSGFQRILPATRIYRTDDEFNPGESLALHTVTACELGGDSMRCESTAVLGPAGRVFYVSGGSVYVWTSSQRRPIPVPMGAGIGGAAPPEGVPVLPMPPRPEPAAPMSAVFRMPLDGSAPSALKTAGVPIDQMSFLEDRGHLNVLLRESGRGEGMWGSERTQGRMALLRVPLAAFGDGRQSAQREHYQSLPAPAGGVVQNRFVGDWLLWGGVASGDRAGRQAGAYALRYAARTEPQWLEPGHAVERIEAMGAHAVLVGNGAGYGIGNDRGDLHFTSVRLGRGRAELAGRHVQPGAAQGETRTHGFFFRPTGDDEGLLGLPVLEAGQRSGGVYGGAQGSASVLYLRQRELAFRALGQLRARPEAARPDQCRASCVDWYGNARPIFIGERVFALLGYELVEGQLSGGWRGERIDERRRITFAPGGAAGERWSPFQ